MRLRAIYYTETGHMPPNTAQHYRPGPFPKMVGECLCLVRAPTKDPDDDRVGLAVQLINDFYRERRLADLIEKWRRILNPLRHKHTAIDQVARLMEEGEAVVLRMPLGADANAVADRPALIELQQTGTLCFHLSPEERRTIAIKSSPRSSIMQIADALCAVTTKMGIEARHRQRLRRSGAKAEPAHSTSDSDPGPTGARHGGGTPPHSR